MTDKIEEFKLALGAASGEITYEWHSLLTKKASKWNGPTSAWAHVFRRPAPPPALEFDGPIYQYVQRGVRVPLGSAAEVQARQFYLQFLIAQTDPAAAEPYDLELVFRDPQGAAVALVGGATSIHLRGTVELSREHSVLLNA